MGRGSGSTAKLAVAVIRLEAVRPLAWSPHIYADFAKARRDELQIFCCRIGNLDDERAFAGSGHVAFQIDIAIGIGRASCRQDAHLTQKVIHIAPNGLGAAEYWSWQAEGSIGSHHKSPLLPLGLVV